MYVINAENVNDAMGQGLKLIRAEGVALNSRNGMTLELPAPVATVYKNPGQRVLISAARDANPFFHLMESLWILAGRVDVKFLHEFNKNMVNFSDNGIDFNAPYGYRLRNYFGKDQLEYIISTLKAYPSSRQAVCQIWDVEDLDKLTKDKACNMSIVFRIRNGVLDMTVYNRSNDMIWGAYGANVVQFSMIQEYVAAWLNIPMGTYTQVSNSFHVYTSGPGGDVFRRVLEGFNNNYNPYEFVRNTYSMTHLDMDAFEHDLKQFFYIYDNYGLEEIGETTYWRSQYFRTLILPVIYAYLVHKQHGPELALKLIPLIEADDWAMAVTDWLKIRIDKRKSK